VSKNLPPYLRRSKNVSELLPLLYLRGLSTGDFREALPVLLGDDAAGLSPSAITRLVSVWQEEYETWRKRSLADRDYVYVWVDGVHFGVRLEDERLCALVMICTRQTARRTDRAGGRLPRVEGQLGRAPARREEARHARGPGRGGRRRSCTRR
jgi:hypothetical protein